ncbi:predicted protein [Micromonas commoda]|uniref:Uncharacterized protein n=1 Tax=Micromonas commoda (strain RCC299 / NOUM17 / CCMP2709) TaxID=296587 RepID=C1E417_MICCC|nr:predicted protein [Micromonas commoda]ACO63032.1 predicted protein [Micromonas commoda]|eukprot:XP_002501774.1 predicted protein [Micromonas commoda]
MMSFASAKLNRVHSGCSRRRGCVEKNRRAARICCASSNESDVEATLELPAKGKQAVLELRVEVSKPLPAVEGKGDAREFVRSDGALHSFLQGGPSTPQLLGEGHWRVVAPGFAGKLFFIGPSVEFYPVNEVEILHSDIDDKEWAQVTLALKRGSIEGCPASVVDWINQAYTTDRTTTIVTVDSRMGMVVTSVDVRISIMVPKLFSLVPTHKIEAAMKASALGSTEAALRTVCDAVGEAWMTYHAGGGLTRV